MRESGGVIVMLAGMVLLIGGLNGTLGNVLAALTGKPLAQDSSQTTVANTTGAPGGLQGAGVIPTPGQIPIGPKPLIPSGFNRPGSGAVIG